MGWLSVLLSIIAAFLFYFNGYTVLMIIAIIVAIGCFWSLGIMHNFATDQAKKRLSYTGRFYDITTTEAESVPGWLTFVNLVFSLTGFILFITGIVLKIIN